MKCKNCGANYRTLELKCPYCGTVNRLGYIWRAERSEAEKEYEEKNKEIGKITNPYVYDRILSRVFVIITIIIALFFVSVFAFFGGKDIYLKSRDSKRDIATLESYYEDSDYLSIRQYVRKYELSGEEYFKYIQSYLMYDTYQDYTNDRLSFLGLSEEEKLTDEYYIKYSIRKGIELIKMKFGNYKVLVEENEALYKEYTEEIYCYFKNVLGLTDDDLTIIDKDYLTSDDYEELLSLIRERKAWNEL